MSTMRAASDVSDVDPAERERARKAKNQRARRARVRDGLGVAYLQYETDRAEEMLAAIGWLDLQSFEDLGVAEQRELLERKLSDFVGHLADKSECWRILAGLLPRPTQSPVTAGRRRDDRFA